MSSLCYLICICFQSCFIRTASHSSERNAVSTPKHSILPAPNWLSILTFVWCQKNVENTVQRTQHNWIFLILWLLILGNSCIWKIVLNNKLTINAKTKRTSTFVITLMNNHCAKKPVTTMLTYPWKCTVLHCNHWETPGNHWCWWPDTLIIARALARVIIKVLGHQHHWFPGVSQWLQCKTVHFQG